MKKKNNQQMYNILLLFAVIKFFWFQTRSRKLLLDLHSQEFVGLHFSLISVIFHYFLCDQIIYFIAYHHQHLCTENAIYFSRIF